MFFTKLILFLSVMLTAVCNVQIATHSVQTYAIARAGAEVFSDESSQDAALAEAI